MRSTSKYRYFFVVLVFTFVGPWIGGLLLSYGFVFYSLFTRERLNILALLTDLVWSPMSAIAGCFFIPSAFVTGLIAALFRLRRTLFSLVLISVIGAISSFVQATLLFEHGSILVWLLFAGLGFIASLICSRFTFPVVKLETKKLISHNYFTNVQQEKSVQRVRNCSGDQSVKKIFGIILYVHALIWALTALIQIYFSITGHVDNMGTILHIYFLSGIGQLVLACGAFAWALYLRKSVGSSANPANFT